MAGLSRIITDAESNFAFWELAEIFGRGLIENLGYFERAAEAVNIDIPGSDNCEIWRNLLDFAR